MMLLAMMAAWWSLARWWESGRPIWLGALLAALVAGAAVQVLTALHTGAMALWLVFLLLRKRGKSPAIPALAISLASLAVLLAPVISLNQKQANFDQGVNFGFPFGRTLMSLSKSWFGDWSLCYGGPTEIAKIAFLVLIAATVALAALYIRRQPSEETAFPLGSFLALWIALPLVGLTLMQGMGGQAVLSQLRYYSGMTPAFALLTAMGLCEARHRVANRPRWQFGLAGATVALPMAASMSGMLLQDGDGLKRLLRQSAKEPVRVFATNDESAVRFEARKYGPSMIHPLTENQPEAELAALGEAHNAVWLLIYNNRKDPRDPLMKGPPAPWTATQALKVGDARMVLLEKSAAP